MMKEYMDKLDKYESNTWSKKMYWEEQVWNNNRLAYTGTTKVDSGYFYCPYIPVMRTTNV